MRSLLLMLILAMPGMAEADILARLAEPRTHAIMRHALAPGTGDPANFQVDDCATQRNLDARGRAQARRAGDLFRAAGVSLDHLWSSQWCRCLETARLLGIGAVTERPELNSFFEARRRGPAQTAATRALLTALPPEETAILVTHFVNLRGLTGETATSGEIVVFRIAEDGAITVLGRVVP